MGESFPATTQDSDFCTDSRRLTGHASSLDGLMSFWPIIGPDLPALSVACLPDVPATPTPPELTAPHG